MDTFPRKFSNDKGTISAAFSADLPLCLSSMWL